MLFGSFLLVVFFAAKGDQVGFEGWLNGVLFVLFFKFWFVFW